MKITEVKAVDPGAPQLGDRWQNWLGQIAVEIRTDENLTGIGVGAGGPAGAAVVNTVLRHALLGQNTDDTDQLWEVMNWHTHYFGRKGLAIMAVSGVDLALWDLRAKAKGKSVAQLLDAPPDRTAPVYWTTVTDVDNAINGGYCGLKINCNHFDSHKQRREIVEWVAQVRDRIGPDLPLMIDASTNWDLNGTLRIAEDLLPYDLKWIEEPLPIDDLDAYAELTERSPIPIAAGEHEYTARGFAELIDRRAHHILQPDVTWCGGLTQILKIYDLASQAGIRVIQHRGAEVWGLHSVVALDGEPLAETPRPWMTWVLDQPTIENGITRPPATPGFGVRFDPAIWRP